MLLNSRNLKKVTDNDLVHLLVGAAQLSAIVNRGEDTPSMKLMIKELKKRLEK